MIRSSPRLCFAGADPRTGNLGVSALCYASLAGLASRIPSAEWTLFDYGRGIRTSQLSLPGHTISVSACGLYDTRRFYRPESMVRAKLGAVLGDWLSPGLKQVKSADVVLDISGGDSFTDLYGPRRFGEISSLKSLSLSSGTPLVLLPQTYGPFHHASSRTLAARLVRGAAACWARDARSFEVLKDLLGDRFDPTRHRCGVDVAFLLPTVRPSDICDGLPTVFAGVNVSGLIWNNPEAAQARYGFKADYRQAVLQILTGLASRIPVVLLPHVLTPRGHYESDRDACVAALEALPDSARSNVSICADPRDPCEAKGIIASASWFMGTRMHATIAGLSSGVPTAAVSYSDKTLGVFETCGQGEHVHDPRVLETGELVRRVLRSFDARDVARASLAAQLPAVLATADAQMNSLAQTIRAVAGSSEVGRP